MYSAVTYVADGLTAIYAVPFPYLLREHVDVSVNGTSVGFAWDNAGNVDLTGVSRPAGATIVIRRDSNRTARLVDFTNGTTLDESVLDQNSDQLLYLIQEAFDQASTQSYFSTDAQGDRVHNVADPIANSDAATKGWVQTYVTGMTASGLDLLPLNNTWTGINTYTQKITIGTCDISPANLSGLGLLTLSNGIFIDYSTNTGNIGYGLAINARRQTGPSILVAAQLNSWAEGTWHGEVFAVAAEAAKEGTATGGIVGLEASAVSMNGNDSAGYSFGVDCVFKHHMDDGTGAVGSNANWHNVNSAALRISAQPRTNGGITFSGWNRGVRLIDQGVDEAQAPAYDASRTDYLPGDYVTYSGNVYQRLEQGAAGTVPTNTAVWSLVRAGASSIGWVGVDLSTIGSLTASRMHAGLKLRGKMPVVWDTEGFISTRFDTDTARFSLRNGQDPTTAVERFAVHVATGDLWLNAVPRVLATRSSFSANRGGSIQPVFPNAWAQVLFPVEDRDDRNEYNTGTSAFTPNTSGDYLITLQVQAENVDANSKLYAAICVNGVIKHAAPWVAVPNGTGSSLNATAHVTAVVRLNGTTDSVTAQTFYSGSGVIAVTGEPTGAFFQGTKL